MTTRTHTEELVDTLLPTGLRVVLLAVPGSGLVDVRLALPYARVVPGRAADMEVLARCLSARRGHDEGLADHGGSVRSVLGPEELTVSAQGLASGADALLAAVARSVTDPAYTAEDVDRGRAPGAPTAPAAARERMSAILGDWAGAAALLPSPARERLAVRRQDVVSAHELFLRPAGAVLVIVGDIDPDETVSRIGRCFGDWTGGAPELDLPPREPSCAPRIAAVPVDPRTPVSMALHASAPRLTDPDHAAFHITNLLVAGAFSGRLHHGLRHRAGTAHHVESVVRRFRRTAWFEVEASAAPGTEPVALLGETASVLAALAAEGPTAEELDLARNHATGMGRLGCVSAASVADSMAGYALQGVDPLWMRHREESLRAVTPDAVRRVATARLSPDRVGGVLFCGIESAGRVPRSLADAGGA